MRASHYRDLLRREKESGVFDVTAHTENPAVKKAWGEFSAHTVKLGAEHRLYTDIQAFLSTRKIAVRDEKFAHKLAAFLSKPEAAQHHLPKLTFGDIALLFAQNGVNGDGFSTAADFYEYLSLVPPLSPELHQQMIAAQKLSMGTSVERTGRNVVTEAIKRNVLRPLLSHPRVVEARLAQEVEYKKQSFLDDGITPAGIQHVLAGQAQAASRNARIPSMTTPESGGVPGIDASAEIAQRTASDVQKLLERAAVNPNNLSFKEKLQLYALCGEGINALTFKNSAGDDVEIERTTSFLGRTFKIRGGQALEGVSVNVADQRSFANLWQSDAEYLRFGTVLETKIAEIAPGNPANQSEIKAVLQAEPFSNHFFRILTGETIASDIEPLLEGYKKAEQTHENKIRHAALTALAQAASFNELTDLYYTQDGRKAELEDQKYWPNELKKILIEGKKYTNKNEKDRVVALLEFPDGENKKWGKFEYAISTEADGSRLYTRKSKRGSLLTFRLTTAEQKQLRDADHEISANPEKEIEGIRKALDEIKSRVTRIERDTTNDALEADKKARHIQYLDLLLKEEGTFPGVYYEKPKPGEGTRDKRTKIQLLKIISADAVAISGSLIEGFSGDIPGIALNKAQLATWKTKLEGTTTRLEKPTGFDAALRALIATKDSEPFTGTPEERAILEKWTAEAKKTDGAVAGGFYKKTNATGAKRYDFASDVSGASIIFSITEAQVVKWDAIKVIKPKKTEDLTGRNAVIDQTLLADTATIDGGTWKAPYFIDDMPVEFRGDLAGRIGARMLDKHGVIPQDKVGIERARQYVKDCPRWKRWGIYIGLGALASLAAFGGGALYSAAFPFVAKSLTWWAGKVLAAGTAGIATTLLSRAAVNKIWKSKYDVSFFEHAKDAAGYEHALRMFKRGKKKFDASEAHRVARFNKYKAAGVPEAVAATYTAKMSDVMAWHEKGRRREQIKSMILPALGSLGTTGFIAYQYFPGFSGPSRAGTFVPNGPRGAGIQPTGRGAAVLQPGGRGPAFTPTGGQNAPVLVDRMVYNITCGYPNGIPVRAIIDGNTVNWYMNGFSPNMRVGCADGGLQYLLGSLDQVPRGGDTRRAISQLFNEALCRDPDLRDTFLNRGNRSSGKWFDYAVLKEYTWMNGRKQLMIDAMMERTNNSSVRSTLAAMKQSIMTGNMQLSVRR